MLDDSNLNFGENAINSNQRASLLEEEVVVKKIVLIIFFKTN